MERTIIDTSKGVSGILRPFKGIIEKIGIQFGDPVKIEKAKVVVVLGGLAMPISPVGREEVSSFLQSVLLPEGTVIGVSFMNMFEQVGWTSQLPFDFWIDATID